MKKHFVFITAIVLFTVAIILNIQNNESQNIIVKNTEALADIQPTLGCSEACYARNNSTCFLCGYYCDIWSNGWATCALTGHCKLNL